MSIVVVGSVAFDDVKTPAGERRDLLGGSATHFAVAASFFSPVRLVGVVGEDFGETQLEPLQQRGVDLGGLQRVAGKTFRWAGEYAANLNERTTLDTQLNVFADFRPTLPEGWESTPVLFLANIDPELQSDVLDKMRQPRLVAADTMNFWIESKREALCATLRRVDILLINDQEVMQLTERPQVVEAARAARQLGPQVVVVKRGEHGALVFDGNDVFAVPAMPLPQVVDPTGAGDAFAGGFIGHLAARDDLVAADYRRAAVVGSVMASFQVEDFSLDRLRELDAQAIRERYEAFQRLTRFPDYEA